MSKVSVLGAGAWGTALALSAMRAGSDVKLWSAYADEVVQLHIDRENKNRLPGVLLDPALDITADLEKACTANIIVLATPAQTIREVAGLMSGFVQENTYLVVASKGIESGSCLLMSEILSQLIPQAGVAILSGPSFADEVARGLPTAMTLAAHNVQTATYLGTAFSNDFVRIYASDDLTGVQIGGALKNVLAIASGIARGKGLGANAEAAIMTRGIVEIARLACALGGKYETLTGLAGLGDIVLTCSNEKSRNMSLGLMLGQGKSIQEIFANGTTTFEGFHTAKSVEQLALKAGIEMPICCTVNKILSQELSIEKGMQILMQRPVKAELDR